METLRITVDSIIRENSTGKLFDVRSALWGDIIVVDLDPAVRTYRRIDQRDVQPGEFTKIGMMVRS